MPIAEPLRARVAALIAAVEVDPDAADAAWRFEEPHELAAYPDRTLLFRGEALVELTLLSFDLAKHALAQGGHSRSAVRELLSHACNRAGEHGVDAAIDWLESQLDQDAREFVVVQAILAHFGGDVLRVGVCEIHKQLANVKLDTALPPHAEKDFPGTVISTRVHARDEASARIIAQSRFDEAAAILVLADNTRSAPEPRRLLKHPDGVVSWLSGRKGTFVLTVDNPGPSVPRVSGAVGFCCQTRGRAQRVGTSQPRGSAMVRGGRAGNLARAGVGGVHGCARVLFR